MDELLNKSVFAPSGLALVDPKIRVTRMETRGPVVEGRPCSICVLYDDQVEHFERRPGLVILGPSRADTGPRPGDPNGLDLY